MKRVKSLLHHITIEEFISMLISFAFGLVLVLGFRDEINRAAFSREFLYYVLNGGYFLGLLLALLVFYVLVTFYVSVSRFLTMRLVEKRTVPPGFVFSPFLRNAVLLCRITAMVLAPFALSSFLLSIWTTEAAPRLMNDAFMRIDERLIGVYPFISLHSFSLAGFEALVSRLITFSFLSLGFVMGAAGFILYVFAGPRRLSSAYVVSILLALAISMPLWFSFPALSPQNAYIDNVYRAEIPPDIIHEVDALRENPGLASFFEDVRTLQESRPPISTMPSMHVAWASIAVYFLFRFSRRTLFLSLPWFFFSTIGTVYLAQHYFVDIVAAVVLAALIVAVSERIARWWEDSFDETGSWREFREAIKSDFLFLFATAKKITRSLRQLLA